MNHENAFPWVALVSLGIASASLAVSMIAARVAKSSLFVARGALSQAKDLAEKEQRDWRQRKWFDLYFKASEFHDSLLHFRAQYATNVPPGIPLGAKKMMEDFNSRAKKMTEDFHTLLFLMRRVHAMAAVFPKHPIVDDLLSATAVFTKQEEAFSETRFSRISDSVESVRQQALLDPSVLGSSGEIR